MDVVAITDTSLRAAGAGVGKAFQLEWLDEAVQATAVQLISDWLEGWGRGSRPER